MEEFKRGQSNCLIATCVVEEGIDVGDVMMIVCFDSNTNQTRYVQRIGRTGRKQQGKVLMLVSEGREHENLKKVLNQKDKTTQKLSNKKDTEWFLYKNSPRLVPQEFNPECLEVCFDIKETETVNEPSTSNAKAKNNKKSKETGPKPANKRRKAAVKKVKSFCLSLLASTNKLFSVFRQHLLAQICEIFSNLWTAQFYWMPLNHHKRPTTVP